MQNFGRGRRNGSVSVVMRSTLMINRCKNREQSKLSMYVVKANDEEFEFVEEVENDDKELNCVEVANAIIELSINSVVGLTNPGTMKVRGKIGDREVIILIDCGVTHNSSQKR